MIEILMFHVIGKKVFLLLNLQQKSIDPDKKEQIDGIFHFDSKLPQ